MGEPSTPSIKQMNLPAPVKVPPYRSQFIPFQVNESPGTTPVVHSQPRISHNSIPFLTKVIEESKVCLPVVNNTRSVKEIKVGTLLGSYEKGQFESEPVLMTHKIHNDLPESDQSKAQDKRPERLRELIKEQNWKRLTKSRQKDLMTAILDHDALFIVDMS